MNKESKDSNNNETNDNPDYNPEHRSEYYTTQPPRPNIDEAYTHLKPFNMGLARKVAKDIIYGVVRKERNLGRRMDDEEYEKYLMGKVYDGEVLAIKNALKDKALNG